MLPGTSLGFGKGLTGTTLGFGKGLTGTIAGRILPAGKDGKLLDFGSSKNVWVGLGIIDGGVGLGFWNIDWGLRF